MRCTLQGWEQGRKQLSGVARTLLAIAFVKQKAILKVASTQLQLAGHNKLVERTHHYTLRF